MVISHYSLLIIIAMEGGAKCNKEPKIGNVFIAETIFMCLNIKYQIPMIGTWVSNRYLVLSFPDEIYLFFFCC